MSFLTLAGPGSAELRIRGSSFLAFAAPVDSETEARECLRDRQKLHFDATHVCSAWRLRGSVRRANDAGEPSGSAGPPILAAIEGAGLVDCMVAVTRYFGGTKLGVGGLVRAYGEAAAAAIEAAPRRTGLAVVRLRVRYDYRHTAAVMRVLEVVESYHMEHGYANGGVRGEVAFSVPAESEPVLRESLTQATAGDVEFEALGERVVYRTR